MRVLVEILHPAHVHFFRASIAHWQRRGDEVLVLARDKDVALQLLDAYGIEHESISTLRGGRLGLFVEMLQRDVRMLKRALHFKPDVLVGIMGVTIVQVGRLLQKPAIVFYDTENARLTNAFVYPLAHSVCTPDCYKDEVAGRHVTYPSYHELAYLHPTTFTPDPRVVEASGISPHEPYFIVRFVSWRASHDLGEAGFDLPFKRALVDELSQRGRVLISSEGPLPSDLESLRFSAPPENMHHILAFSKMLIGESATMASEAAVLGVPAFYIADTGRGYTDEQQTRYQLVWNYQRKHAPEALRKIRELLSHVDLSRDMNQRRDRLLAEKVNTTDWMIDYVDRVVDSSSSVGEASR